MSKATSLIESLEILNSKQKLSLEEINELAQKLPSDEVNTYLEALKFHTKPETAAADLLKKIADVVLDKTGFSEMKIQGGFIDFALQENKVNPILIELKPGFDSIKEKKGPVKGIQAVKLELSKHKEQVQKYLVSNDFLILTNLREAFLFNRDAILDYKPFYKISFTELLKMFMDCENLWDTVRRLEDQHVKPELEKEFFADLLKWFEQLQLIEFEEKDGLNKNELIVLLLNKIIFIKTLEDYGLIPYKFLSDEYFSKYNKWEIKGIKKILDNFFTEIEEWFWDYYDTELFRVKIWDYIVKTKTNLQKFERIFETVLGVGKWEYTFGKGMVHYNYRKIDEDVFGKAYEMFIATTRKDSGIYYTHRLITQYMSEQLIKKLFVPKVDAIIACFDKHDYDKAKTLLEDLYETAICDTTSGSGSFLIKSFREIYYQYQRIAEKLEWVNRIQNGLFDKPKHVADAEEFLKHALLNQSNKRRLIAAIILRHIHAIDIDERALETAKTNMWKEAIKLEKGLFNFRKLNEEFNHILPNLQGNFINADALYDMPISDQLNWLTENCKKEIQQLIYLRKKYIARPSEPEIMEELLQQKKEIRLRMQDRMGELLHTPTLVVLEFYHLFFDEKGNPLATDKCGFAGIISNPPWEEIYPVKKEFANIGKYEMDKADFEKAFARMIKKDPTIKKAWEEYEAFYERYTQFVYDSYEYHQLKPESSSAMRSHLNYFKLLFERNMQLLRRNGFMNILIPSSFQTDEGSYGLRKLVLEENKLLQLFSFENKGFMEEGKEKKTKIFQDVHPQFKFSIVHVEKINPDKNHLFESLFYLLDPKELYTKETLPYSREMVKHFSPDNLGIMEFENKKDYQLCAKIRSEHKLLGQKGYRFRREFNVTDDAGKFVKEKKKNMLPVYEGKIIHQFNSNYAPLNYYADKEAGRNDLLIKETKRIKQELDLNLKSDEVKRHFVGHSYKLDFETYRVCYRAIGRSTDERTLIASLIPPNCFTVNSINYLINYTYEGADKDFEQIELEETQKLYMMALLNSLTLNYYIRNKISANLNMFYLYELPVPSVKPTVANKINFNSFALLYTKSSSDQFEVLRELFDYNKKDLEKLNSSVKQNQLRAELEVLIAKELYGLSKTDWEYLTSTFIYGEDSATKTELDEVIRISKEIY
jgi:chemotaxis methyl-accepting protein methylase